MVNSALGIRNTRGSSYSDTVVVRRVHVGFQLGKCPDALHVAINSGPVDRGAALKTITAVNTNTHKQTNNTQCTSTPIPAHRHTKHTP